MNWDRSRYETLPGQLNLSNKECVTEKERDEELQCVQKHGQWKRTPSSGVKNIKQETEIIKEKYKEDHIRGKKERYTSTRTDTRVERVARLLHNYVKRKRHKRELWVTPPPGSFYLLTKNSSLINWILVYTNRGGKGDKEKATESQSNEKQMVEWDDSAWKDKGMPKHTLDSPWKLLLTGFCLHLKVGGCNVWNETQTTLRYKAVG